MYDDGHGPGAGRCTSRMKRDSSAPVELLMELRHAPCRLEGKSRYRGVHTPGIDTDEAHRGSETYRDNFSDLRASPAPHVDQPARSAPRGAICYIAIQDAAET